MSETQAHYGALPSSEALKRPLNARQIDLTATKLETALSIPPERVVELADRLTGIAAHSGRSIDSLTLAEIVANAAPTPPADGRTWFAAVGKIGSRWHALGQGSETLFVALGTGRRRTFTSAQLVRAARFETELVARRAGRAAGFSRTFALPFPK